MAADRQWMAARIGAGIRGREAQGSGWDRGRIAAPIGSQERQLKEKGFAAQNETTLRPGMRWKWRTLQVATSKPRSRAVTPISRSAEGDHDPGRLLALDAPGSASDLDGHRMHGNIGHTTRR